MAQLANNYIIQAVTPDRKNSGFFKTPSSNIIRDNRIAENPTKIHLSDIKSAYDMNRDPNPTSYKDMTEQRNYNLISNVAKNRKIQLRNVGHHAQSLTDKRSKSTMNNYNTINVDRTAVRKLGLNNIYENNLVGGPLDSK